MQFPEACEKQDPVQSRFCISVLTVQLKNRSSNIPDHTKRSTEVELDVFPRKLIYMHVKISRDK
jgi:hypothetical protein